ncbi:MAG: GNAT family N-acetyltransferase [Burkholderiaceae bacterium]
MLVKLYELPSLSAALADVARDGINVRRALAPERPVVLAWVRAHFDTWAAEVEVAYSRLPIACFVAHRAQQIIGFACYDATAPNFFGPEGVVAEERGRGVGRALLLSALHAQREQGYAYAVIGGVGPASFYEKTVGATPIPGSDPGIYKDLLRKGQAGA